MKMKWCVTGFLLFILCAGVLLHAQQTNADNKLFEETKVKAEKGDATAQWILGSDYQYGKGVKQDYAEAVKWYRKAAEQGNSYAQRNIGVMYHNGKGVKQDTTEAVKWYRKAAEQGNADLELHDFFKSKNSQPTNVQSDEKQPKKVLTPKQYAVIKKILLQRLRRKGILPKDNQPQKKKS